MKSTSSGAKLTPLEQTFLDLAAIDEIHPHENQVLAYIRHRLDQSGLRYLQDEAGNLIARVPAAAGATESPLALVAHTDIAAPLHGRQVVIDPERIKTDGTGLLGADDKSAVALLLELATRARSRRIHPHRPLELVFTVGEEAGCEGAKALDVTKLEANQALVLDWTNSIAHYVTRSPAYGKIDVEYLGRTAHPAQWQEGLNAGAALTAAAAALTVGEYTPGVTFNIGVFNYGQARNQVPGRAMLQAELRSYDTAALETATTAVAAHFRNRAAKQGLQARITATTDSPAYHLNESGPLFASVRRTCQSLGLKPVADSTYGCFDGNILAARGLEVMMLGAAYYAPHSPGEYLNRAEFAEALKFLEQLCYN
jgi:tripeptide aminopeptidase